MCGRGAQGWGWHGRPCSNLAQVQSAKTGIGLIKANQPDATNRLLKWKASSMLTGIIISYGKAGNCQTCTPGTGTAQLAEAEQAARFVLILKHAGGHNCSWTKALSGRRIYQSGRLVARHCLAIPGQRPGLLFGMDTSCVRAVLGVCVALWEGHRGSRGLGRRRA